jgi:hypothetical protein
LYASPNIIRVITSRRMRWAEHVARIGEVNHLYEIFDRKSEWNRPLGRPGRRREDNIGMDIRDIEWEGVDWMHLVEERDRWRVLVNTVTNLRVL